MRVLDEALRLSVPGSGAGIRLPTHDPGGAGVRLTRARAGAAARRA